MDPILVSDTEGTLFRQQLEQILLPYVRTDVLTVPEYCLTPTPAVIIKYYLNMHLNGCGSRIRLC
ncbi:hypothetical protein Q9L58_003017 [Maublancomyces gigas]|uniref:Uncharacterized protein n=1 Tax=Discina gigas TaxID=1032678 RepID=A0ABR3GPT7_9PEZI